MKSNNDNDNIYLNLLIINIPINLIRVYRLLLSNNTLSVLMEGHGIPSLYLNYPSVSIAYWIDKGKSSTIDWDEVGNHIESGKLTILRKKKFPYRNILLND